MGFYWTLGPWAPSEGSIGRPLGLGGAQWAPSPLWGPSGPHAHPQAPWAAPYGAPKKRISFLKPFTNILGRMVPAGAQYVEGWCLWEFVSREHSLGSGVFNFIFKEEIVFFE